MISSRINGEHPNGNHLFFALYALRHSHYLFPAAEKIPGGTGMAGYSGEINASRLLSYDANQGRIEITYLRDTL